MLHAMLWFEALPSPQGASDARRSRDAARLAPLADAGVQRILVPEVLDGQHATMDNIDFARLASQAARLPAAAAVCLPVRDRDGLMARAAQADEAGIGPLLLVGATHSRQSWAGPGLEEALGLLRARRPGVVTIPTRRRWRIDEPHRLLRKQRAGAAFSVSQILFDAREALALRRAYVEALAPREARLPVLYSLAPVCNARDLDFLHLLGVHVPHGLDRQLRHASPEQRPALARHAALRVAAQLAQAHDDEGLGPLGFCVSHVMVGNVEAAIELAACLHDELVQVVGPGHQATTVAG